MRLDITIAFNCTHAKLATNLFPDEPTTLGRFREGQTFTLGVVHLFGLESPVIGFLNAFKALSCAILARSASAAFFSRSDFTFALFLSSALSAIVGISTAMAIKIKIVFS